MTLIGLMGQKRSGKDTVAIHLVGRHGFARVAFADRLKKAALDLDPFVGMVPMRGNLSPIEPTRLKDVVDYWGWEQAKEIPEVRRTLQRLGVAMRHVQVDVWVNATMIDAARAGDDVVVTDVRFPNEATAIRKFGGYLVRVDRPGLPDDDGHVSEHAWRSITPDYVVNNDGDLEHLAEEVRGLMAHVLD